MENNIRMVSSIIHYMKKTKRLLNIPFLVSYNELLLWPSFIGYKKKKKPIRQFALLWTYDLDYDQDKDILDESCRAGGIKLLNYFFQGLLENLNLHRNGLSPEEIQNENRRYVSKIFRMISFTEKALYEILVSGKYFFFKRFVPFGTVFSCLKEELKNSFELYARIGSIVDNYASFSTKQEYHELIKELKIWVHNDRPNLREIV
jgi:hypothetical protein